MNRETKEILLSEVKSISHIKHDEKKFCAVFHLGKGAQFNGEITYNKYTFTPIQQDKIPEIEQIVWKRENIFGGSSITTNVKFSEVCSPADREKFQKLLTPQPFFVGGNRLYPYEFRYVPLLETATRVCKAWHELQKYTNKVKMAKQNLKDVLALKKAQFDLKEYC